MESGPAHVKRGGAKIHGPAALGPDMPARAGTGTPWLRDLALFSVIFGSAGLAIAMPDLGIPFQPYILYFMMFQLFLSFLKIDFTALLDTSLPGLLRLGSLAAVKLIALPAVLYWIADWIVPDYAVPVLLLSGISTGVVAPFIAWLIGAEIAPVLRMVIATSVIVPFSLPCLVKLLAGSEVAIPIAPMIRMLAMVIFTPLVAVAVLRRCAPSFSARLNERQYPIALASFGLINLGVFSKYSLFFFQNPGQLFVAVGIAYVLSALYYVTGFVFSWGRDVSDRLATGVSLAVMNNVLVIVFSSQFFGPLSPTLAAMYMFPFFTMIVPVKFLRDRTRLLAAGGR